MCVRVRVPTAGGGGSRGREGSEAVNSDMRVFWMGFHTLDFQLAGNTGKKKGGEKKTPSDKSVCVCSLSAGSDVIDSKRGTEVQCKLQNRCEQHGNGITWGARRGLARRVRACS